MQDIKNNMLISLHQTQHKLHTKKVKLNSFSTLENSLRTFFCICCLLFSFERGLNVYNPTENAKIC